MTKIVNLLTNFYYPFRNQLLSNILKVDLSSVLFGKKIRIYNYKKIHFGKHILINSHFQVVGNGRVIIEDFTYISPDVSIITSSHNKKNMEEILEDVIIEKLCWIGSNVIILPGIKIGEGSIIGSGSVVSKNIPKYSIAFGNPIKVRNSREINFPYRLPGGKFYLLKKGEIVSYLDV